MLKLTLKNLVAHKRRLISTFLAVVIGVAFLSGNLVLTSTIKHTFDNLFTDVFKGTDAFVRSSTKVTTDFGQDVRGRVPTSLASTVQKVDGVAVAEPSILGYTQIVGSDGKTLGNPGRGAPTFGANWSNDPRLNSFHVVEGRAPENDGEVVTNKKAADDGGLKVGDHTTLITSAPTPVPVTIVGIAKFGSADSAGGATMALLTEHDAEQYVAKPGEADGIQVVAKPGVSQSEVVRNIQKVLPPGTEAITGAQLTKENQDSFEQGLQFFNVFVLIFAGIAVLVSVFSIYNTFSIIVAQRAREMALLRAIGASRTQVRRSILGEAFALGIVASIAGLIAGIGVAAGLKAILANFGFEAPAGGLVVTQSTIITGLIVGVGVTALSSIVPAYKASRVPPIAAMREVAIERTTASRPRIITGIVLAVLGVLAVLTGAASGGNSGLSRAGLGALLLIAALVTLGPAVARAAGRAIGSPLPRLRGMTGTLARDNAIRNPRRTSGTASALMIGVAVVALFTVFAASIKHSIDAQVQKSFLGDLVVDTQTRGFGGLNPQVTKDIAALPQVEGATGLRIGAAKVNGTDQALVVLDPTTSQKVFDLAVDKGSLDQLDAHSIAVSKRLADEKGLTLGQQLSTTYPDGKSDTLKIVAEFGNRDVVGSDYVISPAAWSPHAPQDVDSLILVKLKSGVSLADGKAAVKQVTAGFPNARVQDRTEFQDQVAQMVNQILNLVYVMLALAIVIALMGIANTLSLSIHERTRELGLLRAVGETKSQVRAMIRWESAIIAVFGTIGGLVLGVFLSWALVQAASKEGFAKFALPAGQLLIVLLAGALAGVIAGYRPARRAARLDVLQAIATE